MSDQERFQLRLFLVFFMTFSRDFLEILYSNYMPYRQ